MLFIPVPAVRPDYQRCTESLGNHAPDRHSIRPAIRRYHLETRFQEFCNQSAEMPKVLATIAKEWPNQFGEGEHILPMRHRGEDIHIKSLAVCEHALLMTARAEATGSAGLPPWTLPHCVSTALGRRQDS